MPGLKDLKKLNKRHFTINMRSAKAMRWFLWLQAQGAGRVEVISL